MSLRQLKTKLLKLGLAALVIFLVSLLGLSALASFFDQYRLIFQSPVIFQKPILIEERKTSFINPLVEEVKAKEPEPTPEPRTWDESLKIIIDEFKKFGKKTVFEAILVSWQESKWEEKAIHINRGGSIDRGLWQFNNKWHKDRECVFDAKCATEKATKIFEKQGWQPWYGRGILRRF